MNKILFINTFGIGDVLFTTPLITHLKTKWPQARIDYISNSRTAPVLEADEAITHVYVYDRDAFVAVQKKSQIAFVKKWRVFFDEIKSQKYDLIVDLSMGSQMGLLGKLAGVPMRIGYNYRGRGRHLTHPIDLKGFEVRHVASYHLDLLKILDIIPQEVSMRFTVPQADQDWLDLWLNQTAIDATRPWVTLVPGGGASWGKSAGQKRWPAGKYAELADKIVANSGVQIILVGDQSEKELCEDVKAHMTHPAFNAAGQTTILQLAALMQRSQFSVLNDGGPLHIAVAAGAKTVSIFGPVDPQVYGPFPRQGHEVVTKGLVCQPCYRRFRMSDCSHLSCLRDLNVDEVFEKVKVFL